jgi:hypothetical protein
VLFERPDIAEFAETAALLAKPGAPREAVLRGQDRRVQDFATRATLGRLREIVEGL